MNPVLLAWNGMSIESASATMHSCCASSRWSATMVSDRPFENEDDLLQAADLAWAKTEEADWLQAFTAHPRIGEHKATSACAQSTTWSQQEQAAASTAENDVIADLAAKNKAYELALVSPTSFAQPGRALVKC